MKKIAILSLTIPEIPGKSGGEIRDIYLFKHLGRNYKADYFSIHNYFGNGEVDKEFAQCFENIYYPALINEQYHEWVDESVHLTPIKKLKIALMRLEIFLPGADIPTEILGFRNEFNRYVKRFLQNQININKYDFLFISPQVNPAIIEELDYPRETKVIWATYDVEMIRHNRLLNTKNGSLKKLFYKNEIKAACKYEKRAVAKADGIISVSELDKNVFIDNYNIHKNQVLSVENGVDTGYFYGMDLCESYNIVFVGNMGYAPNDQATRYFIKEVFNKIVEKVPTAHFYAVGANASSDLKALETNNITITGRVEDVRDYLIKAHVVCVPLLTGSGTKYKVLEAMSCQKAVVTTKVGAEGIDVTNGVNIFIEDGADNLANRIIDMLSNKELINKVGKNARQFILENHDWNVLLPKIDTWLESIE